MYNVIMQIHRLLTNTNRIKRFYSLLMAILVFTLASLNSSLAIYAEEPKTDEEYLAEAEARKELTVDTNEVMGWPNGPAIGAEAAILMDAETGQILYAKNIDERLMPASTTKIMTCLTAIKRGAKLDDIITVSKEAIDANDAEGSNMGLIAGEKLSVEEIMTGILVTSANEGCNALAEHMAGSMDDYVVMMNEEAEKMGLENTHFVTTNGLPDPEHYTTARDLAIIAREFFSYDLLCRLSSTPYVEMPETELHNEHNIYSKNKLYKNRDYEYPYLVGSKTGYTDEARQTLVSCAEKDGTKLICVILMEEAPYQFEDTVNLFDYGFNNFSYVRTAEFNTSFSLYSNNIFTSSADGSGSIINVQSGSKVLLPVGADMDAISSKIVYGSKDSRCFATLNYYYNGYFIGDTGLSFKPVSVDMPSIKLAGEPESVKPVVINIVDVLIKAAIAIVIIFVLAFICSIGKKLFLKRKEIIRRNERYKSSRVINRASDRQRKIGRKREQKEIKLQRKRHNKDQKRKRSITKYTNSTRRNKDR